MNNKIFSLLLIAFMALSCAKEKTTSFYTKSITEKELSICEISPCPEITVDYTQIRNNDKVSKKINQKIKDIIIEGFIFEDENISAYKTIEEAASQFITDYQIDKEDFPDMAAEYVANLSVNLLHDTEDLYCFEINQYLYTGGAHGYGSTTFLNINPKTGEELSVESLFKSQKEFVAFAEKKFRVSQNISLEESINSTGFWFEDDTFYLPENPGFTQDSIIFVYNQYDIASYADGPIEFKIALIEAEPFLNVH